MSHNKMYGQEKHFASEGDMYEDITGHRSSVLDGNVSEQESYPIDGRRWYSLEIHWWDSGVILGTVDGNPGGKRDVWATGKDFADAVANAIRHIEKESHTVDGVEVNV